MAYEPVRERDAWFAIRGFVYQVQTTIEQWLQLRGTDELELERGEDVDVLSNWTTSGDAIDRLLGQVKHRDGSLTLNTDIAREALANFIEHRNSNPATNIRFRFVTTAKAGCEANPAMRRRMSGIETWMRVKSGCLTQSQELGALAAIRRLLLAGEKPRQLPGATWESYTRFLRAARRAEMISLISSFEWATSQLDYSSIEAHIGELLCLRGIAQNSDEAQQIYRTMFLKVFTLLCAKGIKRLSMAMLEELVLDSKRHPPDAWLFERLNSTVAALQGMVTALATRVDDHDLRLQAIGGQLEALATRDAMTFSVSLQEPRPNIDPPPGPEFRAMRLESISSIADALNTHTWVAITGTSGCGKTELALQAIAGRAATWIGLRDVDVDTASRRLLEALFERAGGGPTGDRSAWHDRLGDVLGEEHVIVLDDMPTLVPECSLGREICGLGTLFRRRKIRILSTSAHQLSQRFTAVFDDDLLTIQAPSFTEAETLALLYCYGAPDTYQAPQARFLAAVTDGHAELIVTAIRFLRQHEWNFAERELSALLDRSYASVLEEDVVRRIMSTVPDANSRQLLFRSALINGTFDRADLLLLAEVAPKIDGRLEAFATLLGLWIQRAQADKYTVCPLVKSCRDALPSDTVRQVRNSLGLSIMRRPSVTPSSVMTAIGYFLGAEEYDRAGTAYLIALQGCLEHDYLPQYDWGLFDLWMTVPLPPRMDLTMRVYIRTLQIEMARRLERDCTYLASDVIQLAEVVTAPNEVALVALLPRMEVLSAVDFAAATDLVTRIFNGPAEPLLPSGEVLRLPARISIRSFLWHQTSYVRNSDDIRHWLKSLHHLDPTQLTYSATGQGYEMDAIGLCDGVWMREAKRQEAERDWTSALAILCEIEEAALGHGLSFLAASARRGRIAIEGEFRKDIFTAKTLADDAMASYSDAERERLGFFILECLGRQYLYVGDCEAAAEILARALGYDASTCAITLFYAQLSLSKALSSVRPADALAAAESAVSLARTRNGLGEIPKLELVKALGEATIVVARTRGSAAAFERLDETARVLFDIQTRNDKWKDVAVLVAHTSAFLCQAVRNGVEATKPTRTWDGAEEAQLTAGMFTGMHEERYKLWNDEREVILAASLASLADLVGHDDAVEYWTTIGRSLREVGAVPGIRFRLDGFNITSAIAAGDYRGAVQCASGSQEAESVISFTLLGTALAVARLALDDGANARLEAAQCAMHMDELAPKAEGGTGWQKAARVLRASKSGNQSWNHTMSCAESESEQLIRCAWGLMATLCEDAPLALAAGVHLTVATVMTTKGQFFAHQFRRLCLPYLCQYWMHAVSRSAFRFRAPALLVETLREVATSPVELRAQRLLREVFWNLGLPLPREFGAWFGKEAS